MNLPGLTADSSLYTSEGRYYAALNLMRSSESPLIVTAFMPTDCPQPRQCGQLLGFGQEFCCPDGLVCCNANCPPGALSCDACCPPGGGSEPGHLPPTLPPCPSGSEQCGFSGYGSARKRNCCPLDEKCCSVSPNVCCPREWTCCGTECCPPDAPNCTDDGCCPSSPCREAGVLKCCAPDETCTLAGCCRQEYVCGTGCCGGPGSKCCDPDRGPCCYGSDECTVDGCCPADRVISLPDGKHCAACPHGETLCGGVCCGGTCWGGGSTGVFPFCCPPGQKGCDNGRCYPNDWTCCDGSHACPTDNCCGGGCCPSNYICAFPYCVWSPF
jgi:hypothetical protein